MSTPGCRVHGSAPLLITRLSKHPESIDANRLGISDETLLIVVSDLIIESESFAAVLRLR